MKARIFCILCSVFCVLSVAGCEELAIFGGGVAASETFNVWQTNLEAKKAELQAQYDQVMAELQAAPDPNAVKTARLKLDAIIDRQLVNEGALLTVRAALTQPGQDATPQDRTDFWAAVLAGGVGLVYQTLTKRTVATKYQSMKAGQAQFKLADPAAEEKLYALIGSERAKLGL